ncbi:MAG: dihydroorotase [Planctomycetia bacterium]|nr:dihydroorotase [Planctomycetia bacterium]
MKNTSNFILIENGRIIDPSQNLDKVASILIQDDKIIGLDFDTKSASFPFNLQNQADSLSESDIPPLHLTRIDAQNKIVSPGLIDMHVHLREPGQEEDETIESGTLAALAGGFTSIACCPNTKPAIDTQATVELVRQLALRADHCNVFPICCISKDREGLELAELGILFEAGAVACSDDGSSVDDAELMRRAMEYCLMFDKPILSHAESAPLVKGGVMHEGFVSMLLGLRGMPTAAEDVMVSRDITLAEITGARLHIMHVSTEGSVSAIRRAKDRGVRVTAEVTPHHLTLTDECLKSYSTNYKMNPPLRSTDHLQACLHGLLDDTIDAIASDHAPHAAEKKMREITVAPFGIVGLETSLALMIETFIEPELLTWSQLIEKMSLNPAKILGIPKGTLAVGADADLTIIDPNRVWTVEESELHSQSKNTPYLGRMLKGQAETVIVAGKIKFQR